ncbi:Low affinity immunoglobulin epsilon Fc receptor [Galemys pyrenaicus]|nr:Low affinity immunoglobulin epsilon Fc receptor [Galemys pyrenaicus]
MVAGRSHPEVLSLVSSQPCQTHPPVDGLGSSRTRERRPEQAAMDEGSYSEVPVEPPQRRRRCCGRGAKLALLALVTATLWTGMLSLLLLWREDSLALLAPLPGPTPLSPVPCGASYLSLAPPAPPRPAPLPLSGPPIPWQVGVVGVLKVPPSSDWDTVQSLKRLEHSAAHNGTGRGRCPPCAAGVRGWLRRPPRVSMALKQHQGDQAAQRSQASHVSHKMKKIRAELRRMKSQGERAGRGRSRGREGRGAGASPGLRPRASLTLPVLPWPDAELARNLDALVENLNNLKSLGLNERRRASEALERLRVEVQKLWVELRVANGECPGAAAGARGDGVSERVEGRGSGALRGPAVPSAPGRAPRLFPPQVSSCGSVQPSEECAVITTKGQGCRFCECSGRAAAPVLWDPPLGSRAAVPPAQVTGVTPEDTTRALPTAPGTRATAPPTSAGSACNTCPEQWVNFQRKCYYFGEGAKKWIQARYACHSLQGQLVSVHSQEEQDFLTKHANRKGSWIGLQDLDIEGEFVWMDGSPLDYSNWRQGEPNNDGQGEDCVVMEGSGQWNDAFCYTPRDSWVCDRLATC